MNTPRHPIRCENYEDWCKANPNLWCIGRVGQMYRWNSKSRGIEAAHDNDNRFKGLGYRRMTGEEEVILIKLHEVDPQWYHYNLVPVAEGPVPISVFPEDDL